jgi:Na+:H+ antiporter, NhaA family
VRLMNDSPSFDDLPKAQRLAEQALSNLPLH